MLIQVVVGCDSDGARGPFWLSHRHFRRLVAWCRIGHGHSYFPTLGYTGGMRLLEMILGAILDHKDRSSPEESFELVM